MIARILVLLSIIYLVSWQVCGKPADTNVAAIVATDILPSNELNLTESVNNDVMNADSKRQQRSPQFGLLKDYDDYSYEDEDYQEPRHLKVGRKRRPHKVHHKPLNLHGGYHNGCRGYDCGESWHPENGHYGGNHEGQHGGSFATASAGSISGGDGPYGGGHSEASSQSASFNFGPYSASFSVSQAASGRERF